MSLRARTLASARWTLLRVICVNSLQLLQLAVLARLLEPAHFSEIAVVVMILTVVDVFSQTGIDLAIVRDRRNPTTLLDSAWTVQLLRGTTLALLVASLAPALSRYFESPLLLPLLSVAALVPVIDALRNNGPVLLMRDLQQKRLVLAELAVTASSIAVSLALAWWLRSVWALVANLLFIALARTCMSYALHSYRPRLTLRWGPLRGVLRFGLYVNLNIGTSYLLLSLDKFVVRKVFGADLHGIYERAFLLSNFAVIHLYSLLAATIFPSFSALTERPDRFRHHARRYVALLAGCFAGYVAVCSLASAWIIDVVYGAKFVEALPLYRVLLWHAGAHGLTAGITTLFVLLNRPQLSFLAHATQLLALIAGLSWALAQPDLQRIPLALAAAAAVGLATTIALHGLHARKQRRIEASPPDAPAHAPHEHPTRALDPDGYPATAASEAIAAGTPTRP